MLDSLRSVYGNPILFRCSLPNMWLGTLTFSCSLNMWLGTLTFSCSPNMWLGTLTFSCSPNMWLRTLTFSCSPNMWLGTLTFVHLLSRLVRNSCCLKHKRQLFCLVIFLKFCVIKVVSVCLKQADMSKIGNVYCIVEILNFEDVK